MGTIHDYNTLRQNDSDNITKGLATVLPGLSEQKMPSLVPYSVVSCNTITLRTESQ